MSTSMLRAAMLAIWAGCTFQGARLGVGGDATDAPESSIDGLLCIGTAPFVVCFESAPAPNVDLTGTFDTSSDTRCQTSPASWRANGQPESCFVVASSITITSLLVTGDLPLVVAASNSIVVASLDAASHVGGMSGPGASTAICTSGTPPESMSAVGGGGAGGTLVAPNGESGGTGDGGGVMGGTTNADGSTTTLRAGCRGQSGGDGMGSGGLFGEGGGAVYVAAKNTLTISGVINASGAGGSATAAHQAGGGGGGGGGFIVLYGSPIVATGVTIFANGAGGASGSAGSGGTSASDPTPTMASGGIGQGGMGGIGSFDSNPATAGGNGTSNKGGGGGGGGIGYVRANMALTGAIVVSPIADIGP